MGTYNINDIKSLKNNYTDLPEKIRIYLEKSKLKNRQRKPISILDKVCSDDEKFSNHIRSLLNKVNIDNYYTIIPKIKINTQKELEIFVQILLEKVIVEEQYAEVYAKLSYSLAQEDIIIKMENNIITFRKLLLLYCRKAFIKFTEQQNVKRTEAIAFVSFLGELFNKGMLSLVVTLGCFDELIKKCNPICVDMIVALFNHSTKTLLVKYNIKHKELVDKLKTLSKNKNLHMREQVVLEDLLIKY